MYGNTKVKPLRLRPGTNVPITIDDSDFFVQQHYVDFLSRFPDQAGFSFWQDDINRCGASSPGCTEAHRINVSAAFFLSIEFQQTGYLVYRLNQAAFDAGFNGYLTKPIDFDRLRNLIAKLLARDKGNTSRL